MYEKRGGRTCWHALLETKATHPSQVRLRIDYYLIPVFTDENQHPLLFFVSLLVSAKVMVSFGLLAIVRYVFQACSVFS